MTMRNREEAAQAAEATVTNTPDACQAQTRAWFDAPSVGDYDGDGAADAEDGWKSEPSEYKHPGDRNPPRGVPVSYVGGSHDNGHRAISLGNGKIRSTDAGGRGVVATVPLDWPEKAWGLTYVGWSETCDGYYIPLPPPPAPPTRGPRVDEALTDLQRAERHAPDGTKRDTLLKHAIKVLSKIPVWRKRR
jgi:hypothetical protein